MNSQILNNKMRYLEKNNFNSGRISKDETKKKKK